MSKKYRGKTCVYCTHREAVQREHVIGRKAFSVKPGLLNLPKAPACEECNTQKSQLENYASTVLLFGSHSPDAANRLETLGSRRLAKNDRLRQQIARGVEESWARDNDSGLIVPRTTLSFDTDKITKLSRFIARGLLSHHWGVTLTLEPPSYAFAMWLSTAGEGLFDRWFGLPVAAHVNATVGLLSYEGAQARVRRDVSIWRFKFYGGLALTGDPKAPDAIANRIGVITGPVATLFRDVDFDAAFSAPSPAEDETP
jgi:hypothetical protein